MSKSSRYQAKRANAAGIIPYNAAENSRWQALHRSQIGNVYRYAAHAYLEGLEQLELPSDHIPQCREVSDRLASLSGWRVAPVPALIGFKQFFDMLAERVFPAASFIRSQDDFHYVKEPDIFHEIFGHTPLLVDPRIANFSQAIGRCGQQAKAADYAWLARLYWFTIEFGLTTAGDAWKPLGAGLMSSPSELVYAATSEVPLRRPFDLMQLLRTPYRIDIQQPVYYVLDDLDKLSKLVEPDLLASIRLAQRKGLAPPHPALARDNTEAA